MASAYTNFQKRLVLAAYLRHQFGMSDAANPEKVKTFYRKLAEAQEGRGEAGVSHLIRHLENKNKFDLRIPHEDLLRYDDNIRQHTRKINERRDEPITWKYFQLMAALMTEYYLDRVTSDKDKFAEDLTNFAARENENRSYTKLPEVEPDELDKVAYWIATGGGKTLLMHLNYYQAFEYLSDRIDHFILLTPNTGLTRQHRAALQKSGIESVYYADLRDGGGAFPESKEGNIVKVVEIYLLTDKKTGEGKKVEVSTFEGNNLVFVDEGHKGAQSESDTSWFSRRKEIVGDGFTFEYSATYGQAVGKSTTGVSFEEDYGRAILFDYSYQRFYEDGYGKDFRILNLDPGSDEILDANAEVERRYLLANLLAFYEQQFVFERNRRQFREEFNLERPLLVFIGNSVTGKTSVSQITSTKSGRQTVTDVQRLVRFLNEVIRNENGWAEEAIAKMLADDGSLEIGEAEFFEDHFQALRATDLTPGEVLSKMRQQLFHADGGRLHLININNVDGEIGLRAGESDEFFGVIDVGNDRDFMKLVRDGLDDVEVDLEGSDFETALFKKIDRRNSPINVLMGSRKFIEGWSSWRVASMGLMNFGTQRGPQIIQLFGRGVRLLGYNRSLKRSSALPEDVDVQLPSGIEVLETLNIFGVRAKYMDEFRESLKGEGVEEFEERRTFHIKTHMADDLDQVLEKDLQVIRPDPNATFTDPLSLAYYGTMKPEIDLTPQVEAILSRQDGTDDARAREGTRQYVDTLTDELRALFFQNGTPETEERKKGARRALLDLLDWEALYERCWHHRNAEGLTNLSFDASDLRAVIENRAYRLYCPDWMIDWRKPDGRRRVASIIQRILEAYISSFHGERKSAWERRTLVSQPLSVDDANLPKIMEASIKGSEEEKQQDYLETLEHADPDDPLAEDLDELYKGTEAFYTENSTVAPSRVNPTGHLYLPLMTQRDDAKQSPVGLNEGEEQFALDLSVLLNDEDKRADVIGDRELYFLRNQSRGHGMGFAMENGKRFFPDFVLWILEVGHQHMVFVDPKGLTHGGSIKANPKVKFCRAGIGEVESQVHKANGRTDLSLHAFIVSVTDFDNVAEKQELDTIGEFNDYRVYFQKDQPDYIERILEQVLVSRKAEAEER